MLVPSSSFHALGGRTSTLSAQDTAAAEEDYKDNNNTFHVCLTEQENNINDHVYIFNEMYSQNILVKQTRDHCASRQLSSHYGSIGEWDSHNILVLSSQTAIMLQFIYTHNSITQLPDHCHICSTSHLPKIIS